MLCLEQLFSQTDGLLELDHLMDRMKQRTQQARSTLETLDTRDQELADVRVIEEQCVRNVELFQQIVEGDGDLPSSLREYASKALEEWTPNAQGATGSGKPR